MSGFCCTDESCVYCHGSGFIVEELNNNRLDESLSRLRAMIVPGQQKWDLSPNDVEVIATVVAAVEDLAESFTGKMMPEEYGDKHGSFEAAISVQFVQGCQEILVYQDTPKLLRWIAS